MTTPTSLSKRTGAILFLLLASAFLLLNRHAYQGYFQDDEINSMAWTRWGSAIDYLTGTLSPAFAGGFRAVGFFYFRVAEKAFGLDFPKYVAVIQAIHLFNAWILWLLIRRLGAPVFAAAAGAFFFTLHAALFDAVWKPMYVFDLLCGTFCLLSTWLWARGNWIASFVAFWLAFRSKELAVMLPFVLVCYEIWFGGGRWKQLIPFGAASLSWVLQAALVRSATPPPYRFHFSRHYLADTAPFYADQIFLLPYAGFLAPLGALLTRNRRTWFGLAMLMLYLLPLLCLPGRIFTAYCYLPFTGLAIAVAGMLERAKPIVLAALFLVWLPIDYHAFHVQEQTTLQQDRDIRAWMTPAMAFAKSDPAIAGYLYDDLPAGFYPFGAEATLRYVLFRLEVPFVAVNSPEAAQLAQKGRVAILHWNPAAHHLSIDTTNGQQ